MCVLALAWKAHPRWRLVAAANRDEFHDRPSMPLARWDDAPEVLAGRDEAAGGTWMGVSEDGRFAAVTNVRSSDRFAANRKSRGVLVQRILSADGLEVDAGDASLFNPFNLLVADHQQAIFTSNAPAFRRTVLGPGIFGMSNGQLDEPWRKTVRLKEGLGRWLGQAASDPRDLLDLLAPGAALPFDVTQEASASSPIFIRNGRYGTRCSTVIAIDGAGQGMIAERRYSMEANAIGETILPFDWRAGGKEGAVLVDSN